jgi:hypothetical protein
VPSEPGEQVENGGDVNNKSQETQLDEPSYNNTESETTSEMAAILQDHAEMQRAQY